MQDAIEYTKGNLTFILHCLWKTLNNVEKGEKSLKFISLWKNFRIKCIGPWLGNSVGWSVIQPRFRVRFLVRAHSRL